MEEPFISQNCRGLKDDDALLIADHELGDRGVFAACFQETWRTGREERAGENGALFLGCGLDVQTCRRGTVGVGL